MRISLPLALVSLSCSVLGLVVLANEASAGGLEYTGAGTQALGRGGAVTARADDPMVLSYNPAGLVELRGNQMLLSASLALMDACVDPIGYYGWGNYNGGQPSRFIDPDTKMATELKLGTTNEGPEGVYYRQPLDTVCMEQGLTPVPQVGFTARLSEDFGVGFGLMFPSVTPQGKWGGDNGIIRTAQGLRPAATRYMQLTSGTIGLFPTFGLGVRLAKWLRVGASFEWGLITVDNTSMAATSSGTTPAGDIIARVEATDLFIPALNGSIHLVPTDAIDIVAAFRWQDDLNAAGTINLTTGVFDPTKVVLSKENEVLSVEQNFPYKLRAGVRYADRLAPRPSGSGQGEADGLQGEVVRDAFQDERWDIEADLEYQLNGRNKDQFIRYRPGQTADFQSVDGTVTSAQFPDPTRAYTQIRKRWNDQVSVRVGGSYNILPGLFGLSAGVHYENRGIDPSYMQLDYWPLSRVGLHFGVKFRIARSVDFVASFAHIFQETLVVTAPPHAEGDTISAAYQASGNNEDTIRAINKRVGVMASRSDPPPDILEEPTQKGDGVARLTQNATKSPAGEPPFVINSGTYRSSINVVSAGMNLHF
jgi:hypothetical protein